MKQIYANNFATLVLGRQGENLARQIIFDVRDWESLYGPGAVEVIYQRPGDELPYPVAVQRDGTLVTWDVTATDTEMPGNYGECELRYYVGETLAKSRIWRTGVDRALNTPSETAPPEPEQGWVDQVVAVGASAKASAEAAKADADRAEAIAQEVAQNAAKTAQEATGAEQAKEAAQTAQKLAEAAKSAAEAAKQAAETAQSAANKSATDAYGAEQAAEAALKATQDAAAEAAQSLSALRALYEQMQTWAAGIVQSVSDEGARQVQAVRDEGITQTANAKAQADAAKLSADAAAQSATDAWNAKTVAETAKDAAVTAQGKAEDAQKGSEAARDRAEAAAIKQPYPNAETGTWWVWDAEKAAYVDSGAPITDQPRVVEGSGAELALTLANNTETRCTDPVTALTIEGFSTGVEERAEQWGLVFTAAEDGVTVTVPDSLVWAVAEPVFTAGSTYWLSVVPVANKYLAVWTEVVADESATA